ncbi:MAG: hypothetical protein HY593_01410 [Candidatus Omnitrophica bacterium]|nr:hypothetical protein [Candidatus Omnitrophota bacterium]
MDKVDLSIRNHLAKLRPLPKREGLAAGYPADEDFYRFITGRMEGVELERMVEHLRTHREDQELVLNIRELLEKDLPQGTEAPREAVQKAKALFPEGQRLGCPHCGKAITPFKKPLSRQRGFNVLWLGLGIVSFTLSFVFPRYFLQFLVLTCLFGVKWIVDQRVTKTQIMVYKALQETQETEGTASRVSNRISGM